MSVPVMPLEVIERAALQYTQIPLAGQLQSLHSTACAEPRRARGPGRLGQPPPPLSKR